MARLRKSNDNLIAELRARHIHCVTWNHISHGFTAGDWQDGNYDRHRHKVGPACSYPDDRVCAAPGISTEYVLEQIQEVPEDVNDAG